MSERSSVVRLSPDAIVEGYIRLADRGGTDVTLRALGAELGVDPTAVYRHFRDKEELLAAVADRLLAEVLEGFRRSGDWRRDIRGLVLGARRVYLGHPHLAQLLATSPDHLPNNARIAEIVIGALRAAGLPNREAALAFEVLENYTAGASSLDAEVGADVGEGWRRHLASLPREQFPNTVTLSTYLYRDDEVAFGFGLDLMLDALQARAARARR